MSRTAIGVAHVIPFDQGQTTTTQGASGHPQRHVRGSSSRLTERTVVTRAAGVGSPENTRLRSEFPPAVIVA